MSKLLALPLFTLLFTLLLTGCGSHQVLYESSADNAALAQANTIAVAPVVNTTTPPEDYEIAAADWQEAVAAGAAAFNDQLDGRFKANAKGPVLQLEVVTSWPGSYKFTGIEPAWIKGTVLVKDGERVLYAANFWGQSGRGWDACGLKGRIEQAYREVAQALNERLGRE